MNWTTDKPTTIREQTALMAIRNQAERRKRRMWCERHQREARCYADGVIACPDCIAERALSLMQHNGMREDF